MKLIIAGGRDYDFTEAGKQLLERVHQQLHVTEVVSRGCAGADACGEARAREYGIPVRVFHADRTECGEETEARRNRGMVEYADAVALFPGGAGTASMDEQALAAGLLIFDQHCALSVSPDPSTIPLGFGFRFKRGLRFWLPLWIVISLLPLLSGDYEDMAGKLLVGTPMIAAFVAMWAAVRDGLDVLRHRKQTS
ncbi:MAG: SLOG family protein [Candidatus Brocadiia bacterium]